MRRCPASCWRDFPPYGKAAATLKTRALLRATYVGFPVVNVGRGNTEGFAIRGQHVFGTH